MRLEQIVYILCLEDPQALLQLFMSRDRCDDGGPSIVLPGQQAHGT